MASTASEPAGESAAPVPVPAPSAEPILTLHQFPGGFGAPGSLSPFCTKLEAFLLLAGVPYRNNKNPNFRQAPKGKLPFVEWHADHSLMGDSQLIIETLLAKNLAKDLDAGLTAEQAALALFIRRTCEDHLYFALMQDRWADDQNWPVFKAEAFKNLPAVMRAVVPFFARSSVTKKLDGQGIGRHEPEIVHRMAMDDIAALRDFLGSKPYFFTTAHPSLTDIVVYSFVSPFLGEQIPNNPMRSFLREKAPNLVDFCQRMESMLVTAGLSS